MEHQITLPNSYYVPGALSHILSPQHWLQTTKENKPNPRGTWCATYDDEIVLWWNQRSTNDHVQEIQMKQMLPLS